MSTRQIFNPEKGPMRIICGLSLGGSVTRAIIQNERNYRNVAEDRDRECPYKVVALFSDRPTSGAKEIGEKFGIPVHVENYREFCAERKGDWKDMSLRAEFEDRLVGILRPYNPDLVVLAGYMLKVTPTLLRNFMAVNVHPADLSILDDLGKRKFIGAKAVEDAMKAREKEIRASVHIVTEEVDLGPLLAISAPLEVDYSVSADDNQGKLKEVGDKKVLPWALEQIADGQYAMDEDGRVYFQGRLVENGVRL